ARVLLRRRRGGPEGSVARARGEPTLSGGQQDRAISLSSSRARSGQLRAGRRQGSLREKARRLAPALGVPSRSAEGPYGSLHGRGALSARARGETAAAPDFGPSSATAAPQSACGHFRHGTGRSSPTDRNPHG